MSQATLHTEFHEQTEGGRTARSTVCPEDNIVGVGITSALEEVEEQMASFDVDIAGIRPAGEHNMRFST